MSVKPDMVTGQDCLNWLNKDVGFCNRYNATLEHPIFTNIYEMSQRPTGTLANTFKTYKYLEYGCNIWKWSNNKTKRVVGHVKEVLDDGGLVIDVYGTDKINNANGGNCLSGRFTYKIAGQHFYNCVEIKDPFEDSLFDCDMKDYPHYPPYVKNAYISPQDNESTASVCVFDTHDGFDTGHIPYDMTLNFTPIIDEWGTMSTMDGAFRDKNGNPNDYFDLSQGKMQYGLNITNIPDYDVPAQIYEELCDNPLYGCIGDVYGYLTHLAIEMGTLFFGDGTTGGIISTTPLYSNNRSCQRFNNMCLIYNMVLTNNLSFAMDYIENGTLPQDAFLYPLDWENLPSWSQNPEDDDNPDDNPDDEPDDNNPDDDSWDIDNEIPEPPHFTPFGLSNYNWYWLSAPELESFIHWFWHDIGDFHDFSDIIDKIKGLYNDVASAVMMLRFMPVNPLWIGGLGTQDTIKLGMIEKGGFVNTLAGNTPSVRNLGAKEITPKYKSFIDYAPYSQLSLYLPYHGFIDLDINIFNNNKVRVYAVYDVLSGTIQYFIYCELSANERFLVNSVVAKMGVDIPITLQTKNDRDSSIFQNVSSTVGGLIGAGVGIASGNPIGVALGVTSGVQAMTSSNSSAPLNVKGNVSETGAFYSPHKCRIVLRRPTIQASDKGDNKKGTWLKHVGRTACYGYYIGKDDKNTLKGTGFTQCENPRINFTNTIPLQSEIEEIYKLLEEGVIL